MTDAKVDRLIPLYAIGVFLSFTLTQAGMAKHHITHKEPKWRTGLVINGLGAFVVGHRRLVIAATKFPEGAWVIIILVPVLVVLLFRLNRQYTRRRSSSSDDAPTRPPPRCWPATMIVILVDSLDLAAARRDPRTPGRCSPTAWWRSTSTSTRAAAASCVEAWSRLGLGRVPLEVVECPDRQSSGRRSSSSPSGCPTPTPRSPCSSPGASTAAAGTAWCTTRPRTTSPRRWPTSTTATSRSCRSTSARTAHRWLRDDDSIERATARWRDRRSP